MLFEKRSLAAFVPALMILGSGSAFSDQIIEEIVVTAKKRTQNLQEVGISITALAGERIRDFNLSSSEDIALQTPGLTATNTTGDSSVSIFSIRGVGQNDFADHQEAPTAVYVDGIYVGYTGAAGVQMYDLDRVEILRGPQGTLFGRNATGGLIHLVSAQPTEEFSGYSDLTLGSYNQVRFEGAISGALSENLLARFSVLNDDADGYFENKFPGGDDLRERDNRSLRLQLDYAPNEDTDIELTLWSNTTDKAAGGVFDTRPTTGAVRGDMSEDFQGAADEAPAPNEGNVRFPGFIDKDAAGADITVSTNLGGITFTSITGYSKFDKDYKESSSTSTAIPAYIYTANQDSSQFSQELRFNAEGEHSRWQAGFYYLNLDGDWQTRDDLPTFGGSGNNVYTVETNSWSAFGQGEYDITNDLTLTMGLRWVNHKVEMELDSFCTPASFTFPGVSNDCADFTGGPGDPLVLDLGVIKQSIDDNEVAVNLALDYRLDSDQLLYASYNRGVKGGGFTVPIDGFLRESELKYDPEILNAYEFGYKSTHADGRLRLNAGVFYYDYEDYQAFIFSGLASQVVNRDAEVYGAELELTVLPAEGWELQLGLSALDATVKDIGGKDENMVLAPDFSANFAVRKTWTLGDGATVLAQVDGSYTDDREFNTNPTVLTKGDSYELFNARASYTTADGNWEISAFVKNLTDEEYFIYAFDIAADFGNTLDVYGPPRWSGLQARYNW